MLFKPIAFPYFYVSNQSPCFFYSLSDYNFEATYYGAFSSNHHAQAEPYFQAVLDGVRAAQRGVCVCVCVCV